MSMMRGEKMYERIYVKKKKKSVIYVSKPSETNLAFTGLKQISQGHAVPQEWKML